MTMMCLIFVRCFLKFVSAPPPWPCRATVNTGHKSRNATHAANLRDLTLTNHLVRRVVMRPNMQLVVACRREPSQHNEGGRQSRGPMVGHFGPPRCSYPCG